MKTGIFALAFTLSCAQSHAAELPSPTPPPIAIGDSWTYKRTVTAAVSSQSRLIFKIARQGADQQYIYQSIPAEVSGRRSTPWRTAGSVDMDACMIDFFGGGTLGITNSCATTFTPGMDWTTEVTANGSRSRQRYQVVGMEEVRVRAGSFQAIKIESHWDVEKILNPGQGSPARYGAPQRYHFTYWYAPETRSMVKTERAFRTSGGALESQVSEELEGYRQNRMRDASSASMK